MRTLGALEVQGKQCFQSRLMMGVDIITRCKSNMISVELRRRRLDVNWREGIEEEDKYFVSLRGDTHSDVLRRRLEGLNQ